MKHAKSILTLLSISLSLCGCSSPKLHEPDFEPYGPSIEKEPFEAKLSSRYSEWIEEYFTISSGEAAPKSNLIVDALVSQKYDYSSDDKKTHYTAYTESSEHDHIDATYQRFTSSADVKIYLTGDYDEYISKGELLVNIDINRYYQKKDTYAEIKNGKLHIVDFSTRTVVSEDTTFNKAIPTNAILTAFDLFISVGYDAAGKFYYKSDTFSYVYYSNAESETIIQLCFHDGLFLKYKNKGVKTDSKGTAKTNTSYEISILKTDKIVEKRDYSDFE